MKIIGVADKDYIIHVSNDELSNLIGYYYSGSEGHPKLKVGDSINISEMYMQLHYLQHNEKQCEAVAKKLKDIAEWLITVNPVTYFKKDPE